jgi:hypothetical protein
MTPLTQESRLFTIFFAIVGISVVALAMGEISGFIIEKETAKVEEFNRLLAQKLSQVRHLLAQMPRCPSPFSAGLSPAF